MSLQTTMSRLPWWVTVDVNSDFGCLNCGDLGSAPDGPEVHAASAFMAYTEDGGSVYIRNIGSTAHIGTAQTARS
jgi:hypothetical protein